MSTRAYLTIINNKQEVIDSAFCPSSAYPSYLGLEILDAISQGKYDEFLEKVRNDYPDEKDMLNGIQRSWYIRGKDNKDDFFHDYAYEYDIGRSQLHVYHFGDKVITITPKNIDLYRFIFENEDLLYDPLCFDKETMSMKKDFYRELRTLTKSGATQQDFQTIMDDATPIYYLSFGRLQDHTTYGHGESFIKYIIDAQSNNQLKLIADNWANSSFSIYIQTPFFRAPLGSPTRIRSAAAAERAMADIIRRSGKHIGATMQYFGKINQYLADLNRIYENDSISLNDRADQARDLRLTFLADTKQIYQENNILGLNEKSAAAQISEADYNHYLCAKKQEEQEVEKKLPLDEIVNQANDSHAGMQISMPKEDVLQTIER